VSRKRKPPTPPEGSFEFTVPELCRSELDAAIDVLVQRGNLIATHVLASAAHDVMRGYATREGLELRADMPTIFGRLAPAKRDRLVDAIFHPYNSMKHSNSSDVAVAVHPDLVDATLFCATQEYGSLFGHLSPKMVCYIAWFTVVKPSLRASSGEGLSSILQMFPSALAESERPDQLLELKELLREIDENPERYIDYQAAFATAEMWGAPVTASPFQEREGNADERFE